MGSCSYEAYISLMRLPPRLQRINNTHRNKRKHQDARTIATQVHCTLRFGWHMNAKWFVFTSYILPLKYFFYMTQKSGSNPRELHGKIPTTSLSFEAGSEVHPYCFQHTHTHTRFGQARNDNEFHESNQKLYRGLVAFFKTEPSFLILKTRWPGEFERTGWRWSKKGSTKTLPRVGRKTSS